VHGSGALFRWLLDSDLVDEMSLFCFPVVVGQGRRLFPDTGRDWALHLVDSGATPKGITIQVYRPTGHPEYGTATPNTNTPDEKVTSALIWGSCPARPGVLGVELWIPLARGSLSR
jgi:hypothetical protein